MPTESDAGVETLLVGVDAACPRILDELFEKGVTPNLESFFDAAASGPLASQLPPWTPSAWPSIYTGVNPGKHGVFGFLRFRGYDWDVVDYGDVREFSLWELLGQQGKQSVVVNVPVTGPPRSFPGALVPGYVAPEEPTCHPDGLFDELREVVPEYRVYPPDADRRDEQLQHYRDCVSSRVEAFDYLVDRFAPDFGFVQFQVCDTVFHEYPGDWNAVESVYEAVDEAFGHLLDEHDPETVVVASDHGIGEYGGYEFRVNEYLADRGYIETTRDGSGMPSWASIAREQFHDGDEQGGHLTNAVEQATQRAVATAARAGVTADRVYRYLDRVGLAEPVAERLGPDIVRAGTRRVDFGESMAFMRDRIELGVRLNVIGREPDGVVSPDDYDSVRTELVDALERAQTPDGERVFERVLPREAVFHGPYVEEAPDLIVVPAGFDQFLSASLRGDQFAPPSESWNHKPTGSVAIVGPNIDQQQSVRDAGLLDIAPTICSSVGVPVPDRMDGEALDVVPTPPREQYPPYPHGGGGEATRRHPAGATDYEPIEEIE
ncbi:alkaline phosphatase family protein [Haloarchaeobius litoreus]|uniref:Alkaline phosphatase family protein n=1 Tax=Haloarchaeobius litoreus TaxID=755306 RepID=A0ABD6DPR2_9EURY|nr:alkaline phosphatase family protein [Haloarchaeobius litoreus]